MENKKISESEYKHARELYEHLKSRRYSLKEFELSQAKIEMKRAQQYHNHIIEQISKCDDGIQKYSEIIEAYTIENELFPDSDKNEVAMKLRDLTSQEMDFVKKVVKAPGCTIKNVLSRVDENQECYLLAQKPCDLGLIYPVGKFKWRPNKKTMLYFKKINHVH